MSEESASPRIGAGFQSLPQGGDEALDDLFESPAEGDTVLAEDEPDIFAVLDEDGEAQEEAEEATKDAAEEAAKDMAEETAAAAASDGAQRHEPLPCLAHRVRSACDVGGKKFRTLTDNKQNRTTT